VAGTANTVDVASSASTPLDSAAGATTSLAQSENKQESASVTAQESNKLNAEGAVSNQAAPADFSSFFSANKQQSPFAVKAGGESSAFSGGNALSFGSTAGGFGAIGQACVFSCKLVMQQAANRTLHAFADRKQCVYIALLRSCIHTS